MPRCIVHCAECTTALNLCLGLEPASCPDIRKLFAKVWLHSQSAKNIWFASKNNRFAMRGSSMFEQSLIRANVDPKELDCWIKQRFDCWTGVRTNISRICNEGLNKKVDALEIASRKWCPISFKYLPILQSTYITNSRGRASRSSKGTSNPTHEIHRAAIRNLAQVDEAQEPQGEGKLEEREHQGAEERNKSAEEGRYQEGLDYLATGQSVCLAVGWRGVNCLEEHSPPSDTKGANETPDRLKSNKEKEQGGDEEGISSTEGTRCQEGPFRLARGQSCCLTVDEGGMNCLADHSHPSDIFKAKRKARAE